MQTLAKILKQRLENAARVAILGVGSELRGDDVAGILAAQRIGRFAKKTKPELEVFIGATAPENLTGEIKRFRPTHLIIIDSADLESQPGHVALIAPENISGTTFCTHSLPLKIIIDYLRQTFDFELIVIGIQPKTLVATARPSKEVSRAVELLSATITSVLL